MKDALTFYTGILDFKMKYKEASIEVGVVDLINGEAEPQLTVHESATLFCSAVNVSVDEANALFKKYLDRGLDIYPVNRIHQYTKAR